MVKNYKKINCKKDYISNIELKLILYRLFKNKDIVNHLYNIFKNIMYENRKINYYDKRQLRMHKLMTWSIKTDIKHISSNNFIQYIDNKKNIKKNPNLKLKLKLINNSKTYKRNLVYMQYLKHGEAHINLYQTNNGNYYNLLN